MASMYEQMNADEGSDAEESAESPEEEAAEGPAGEAAEHDPEFEMHAKTLGYDTPEKLDAFKGAIERCVDLREQNQYSPGKGGHDEGDEGDAET